MHPLSVIAASSGGGSIVSLLFLPLIFVAMYFLMIRPQRRRQKATATLQRSVEVGDEIMTTSGVYGFVTGFDGDIAWLEVDDNVQIRVARAAIQRRVDTAKLESPDNDGDGRPRHTKMSDIVDAGVSNISDDEPSK
jgi:preprotein translocase subunit YajC